jgi:hypothetical protein
MARRHSTARLKLHEFFERACSRYAGRRIMARQRGLPVPDRSPLWFRAAAKVEWWLRPGPRKSGGVTS